MIQMNNWATQAFEKLKGEKGKVSGQKEKVMAPAVLEAIRDFCRQDEEFAQAVVQGGTFADCMAAVAKGVGNSISDLEAYRKAVAFYFPGAKIRMQLTIDLIGDAAGKEPEPRKVAAPAQEPKESKPNIISLDLADFF